MTDPRGQDGTPTGRNPPTLLRPQPTGRRLVKFHHDVPPERAARLLEERSGGRIATSARGDAAGGADVVLLDRFGIAAIGGDLQRATTLARTMHALDEVADSRPEFWMFRFDGPPWADTAAATWGIEAVRAGAGGCDGRGIRVAVLDTGLDLGHPDWAGRDVVTRSFVEGETVDDVQGHGTHCAGTIAGRLADGEGGNLPRYGVAPGVSLHVGKVLNNAGSGRELDIIAAIEWAIEQKCDIVSMSLGRATAIDEEPDFIYEDVGARALEAGCLVIAAAGNESDRRFNYIAPVGSPANAPSIMAVAAIGADGGIATFSCGGVGRAAVDIAGPGVQVFSSVPRPQLYAKFGGTSMACPHVAGVAALWAEADPCLRGQALWDRLTGGALALPLPPRDVGAGLVQAP